MSDLNLISMVIEKYIGCRIVNNFHYLKIQLACVYSSVQCQLVTRTLNLSGDLITNSLLIWNGIYKEYIVFCSSTCIS